MQIPGANQKSFLRWAGSKRQLLPAIAQYWTPTFNRYIEPFCGSASLYFSLKPSAAILSDLNEHLIETLTCVQRSPDLVSESLARYRTDRETYYKVRRLNPSTLTPVERAARFIYLNLLCFNGLYRVNKQGEFNVPYGAKQRKKIVDAFAMRETSRQLSSCEIVCCDFEETVCRAEQGDFLYLDPPYATADQSVFTEYNVDAFSPKDLERLKAALNAADRRGVSFVLSYANVPEITNRWMDWPVRTVTTRRNIAGFTGSRRYVEEVLISNIELFND
ncbi:MAG: DNA adenine methylase [Pseudomonadota bacterium]